MFHFPASPPAPYEFRHERPGTTPARFPHSDTLGSKPACRLPEAYRRLQRPSSAPGTQASTERPTTPTTTRTHTQRAGTDARVHYTIPNHHATTTHPPPTRAHGQHGHSTQTPDSMPVNALPQPQPTRTTHAARRLLPRKEVIQPHLPVRLPCYDFVPIANPTFDRSPHTG